VSAAIHLGMTMCVSSCVLISKRAGTTTSDLMWAGLDGPAHWRHLIYLGGYCGYSS